MAYYRCGIGGGVKLPDSIAISMPPLNAIIADKLINNSANEFDEKIIVDTGVSLENYTVSGGAVSGTSITVTRKVTVKNNPSNVYLMVTAPQVTITAKKK